MFNPPKKAQDPTYLFDLRRYYKIWFSANPNQFLGIEDQLRFVRMREDNRSENLYFIYSRVYLSATALEDLNKFCRQYRIEPIAFEDMESILVHEQDKALYKIAQAELANCIDAKEGNMASASDCVRLLVPVIERYGIYGDFDVRLHLSTLKIQYARLRGPLLFPAETIMLTDELAILAPNSDFLACSLDQTDHQHLSADALKAIRSLQRAILKKYQASFSAETIFGSNKLSTMKYVELPALFSAFHEQYPNNPTIYDFRRYVKTLPDHPQGSSDGIPVKTFLTRLCVINMSGPGTYPFLFEHQFPRGINEPPLPLPYKEKKWLPFLALYERCGTGFYDPIYDAIKSNNSAVKAMNGDNTGAVKDIADFSWTQDGMQRKQKREEELRHSALITQRFWRKTLDSPCYKLYKLVKSIDSMPATVLEPIKQNKLALALRRASAGIKLDVIKLLVEHHQKYPFNVNEVSASSPNTALDWIINAKPENDVKKEAKRQIITHLKSVGAKMAHELALDQRFNG